MSFARFLPIFLLACATTAPAPEPRDEPAPEPESTPSVRAAADAEAERVLANRYYAIARRHWERSELAQAESAILRALALRPDNLLYRDFHRTLGVDMGRRSASVEFLANEAVAHAAVRREEEQLTIRRLLGDAERAKEREDWEAARRAYERALFVLRTSPFREDAEFEALSGAARSGAGGLDGERAESGRRRRADAEKLLTR